MSSAAAPRVAFYMHRVYNGGVERVWFNLAAELLARGVQVDLVVNQGSASPFMAQLPAGVRLVDLGSRRFADRTGRLVRYLRRERPAALLSALHFSNEIAVLAAALARCGTRVVVTEHTTLSADLASLPRWHPRRWAVRTAAALAYRAADAVVAVSRGAADDLARFLALPRERVDFIYNPVLNAGAPALARAPVDHRWFADDGVPVILSVGRLEAAKDFAGLIDAFALLRRERPCRLLILGQGSLRGALLRRVAELGLGEDVELAGFVANPYAYMARANVFVVSSAWEGFCAVLVEALALGTPVVSTDCHSGPAEILDGGRYGALVPVGRPPLLAQAIRRCLDGERAAPAPADWLARFTPAHAVQRYAQVLQVPLAAPARP